MVHYGGINVFTWRLKTKISNVSPTFVNSFSGDENERNPSNDESIQPSLHW